ncbi:MAG: VOC family protein [Pseudomonadota bacterium]
MANGILEHVNITVSDNQATARMLSDVFGWHIRWQGDAISGGHSIHIGNDDQYLAIYTPPKTTEPAHSSYIQNGGLNHVGVVVDDIDATERRVTEAGFTPINHADYEPGRRFYFHDGDDIEWEVVSYS